MMLQNGSAGSRFVFGRLSCAMAALASALTLTLAVPVRAADITDDMVGQDLKAWELWSLATRALEREKADEAQKLFDGVAALKLTDLRLALMADRSGTTRLEQAVKGGGLGETGTALVKQVTNGRRQRQLAEDGWHFAAIGRFNYADANFKALVESAPDPVALLELSRYNAARTATLVKLVANADVGPSAKLVLKLLQEGERMLRMDAREIEVNIARLGGPPRVAYQAANNLKASGEYAVPQLIAALRDPKQRDIQPQILQLLPQLGREAITPMSIALEMKDGVTKTSLIRALAGIGYKQAIPYLARVVANAKEASGEAKSSARTALSQLGSPSDDTAQLFRLLAEDYYNDAESLRADARFNNANVWYWDAAEQDLRYIAVPREIYNDVMTMRCAEACLKVQPANPEAMALWVAANFRREAKLGMDVESEAASELAAKDATKPEGYPRAIYFARAAGPLYNHMALSRAVRDKDPGVALGTIAALNATAGAGAMVGGEEYKQGLSSALAFPNRLVRIKAALAIARSLPQSQFAGSQNVVPVLSEALGQTGRVAALVIDADAQSLNAFQGVLRAEKYEVVGEARLASALERARRERVPGIDAVLIASDVQGPALAESVAELRKNFETAAAPILIVVKKGDTAAANRVARQYGGVDTVLAEVVELGSPEETAKNVMGKLDAAARKLGRKPMDAGAATGLAMEALEALRLLAVNRSSVFEFVRAEGGLIGAVEQGEERLRVKAAEVLALVPTDTAQKALARTALDEKNSELLRVSAFAALADSARFNGNKLDAALVEKVVGVAKDEKNLSLRTACSRALGALNLTTNDVSEIIRGQSRD